MITIPSGILAAIGFALVSQTLKKKNVGRETNPNQTTAHTALESIRSGQRLLLIGVGMLLFYMVRGIAESLPGITGLVRTLAGLCAVGCILWAIAGATQAGRGLNIHGTAQKLLIFPLGIFLACVGLGPITIFVVLGSILCAIIGITRVAAGLEMRRGTQIILWLVMLSPVVLGLPGLLVGLITLGFLNAKAVAYLKAAGYTVGTFGAKEPPQQEK
jgi:hypothetical protein